MRRETSIAIRLPPLTLDQHLKRQVAHEAEDVRVQFRTPHSLHRALSVAIVEDGYGPRGRSRWVGEAMERMLNDPVHQDVVTPHGQIIRHAAYKAQALEMAGYDEPMVKDVVILPRNTWRKAWHAMVKTMLYGDQLIPPEHPEITVGDVIRVSILYRLQHRGG